MHDTCTVVLGFPVPFALCTLSHANCHWNSHEALQFQYFNHVSDCSVQSANRTRNPKTTVRCEAGQGLQVLITTISETKTPFHELQCSACVILDLFGIFSFQVQPVEVHCIMYLVFVAVCYMVRRLYYYKNYVHNCIIYLYIMYT